MTECFVCFEPNELITNFCNCRLSVHKNCLKNTIEILCDNKCRICNCIYKDINLHVSKTWKCRHTLLPNLFKTIFIWVGNIIFFILMEHILFAYDIGFYSIIIAIFTLSLVVAGLKWTIKYSKVGYLIYREKKITVIGINEDITSFV